MMLKNIMSKKSGGVPPKSEPEDPMSWPGSELISTLSDGGRVIQVDGSWVRNNKSTDFWGGANNSEDPMLCKKGDYLVEEMEDETDEDCIVAHEVIEDLRMQLGDDYDRAHDFANSVEAVIRGNTAEKEGESDAIQK